METLTYFDDPATMAETPIQPKNYGIYVKPKSEESYRTQLIEQGFDWPAILADIAAQRKLPDGKLYLVVFRSTRAPGVDGDEIARHDEAAHEEALRSDELLHYFAGAVDDTGQAMSWCLWTGAAAAREALSGPAHQGAVQLARGTEEKPSCYTEFGVELYDVSYDGATVDLDRLVHPSDHRATTLSVQAS